MLQGLELDIVENDQFTDSGWLKLEFDGVKVGITEHWQRLVRILRSIDCPWYDAPKMSAVAEADWMRPVEAE